MNDDPQKIIFAALVGIAGWFVKDFLYGIIQRRNQLERSEWEYRLKEVYCPLYFWSGLLAMRLGDLQRSEILEQFHSVMAKASYVLPSVHYYVLVRLLEAAHEQVTSGVSDRERNDTRAYLHNQIEVLNFVLYRSDETGGVGDPAIILTPYKRVLRLLLIGFNHVLMWLLITLLIGGALLLYDGPYLPLLGLTAIVVLVLLWIDVRQRRAIRLGLQERMMVTAPKGR